jgi:3-hydroxybutyryl-CoA dehydrogenase
VRELETHCEEMMDANGADLTIGIIGAGTMGRGIAQVSAVGGMRTRLYDTRPGAAEEARDYVSRMLGRSVEKGTLSAEDRRAALGRIEVADGLPALRDCHTVVEAIIENLEAKRNLLAQLESEVDDRCIIATNTSSLSVTAIGAGLKRPERFAGFHFFNPVPLMKLVEVIGGVRTEAWVLDALVSIGRRMGREPVRLRDAPGFLVNQVIRGLTLECAHIAEEGIAEFAEIDRIVRDVGGFRMGPFELMDLTGLDVTQPASIAIYEQSFDEPRYRPTQLMQKRHEGGMLGRKSGRGFYRYTEGKPEVAASPPVPALRAAKVWVSREDVTGHSAVVKLLQSLGATLESTERPSDTALILVTPIGDDTTTCAHRQSLDPKRTVAIDTLYPLATRRTIMTNPATDPSYRDAAHGLLAGDAMPVSVIADSPGFVMQRVAAMIVNIGCSLAANHTASPGDVDKGATLGLNFPIGPLALGDRLGPMRILRILESMASNYGDPRYRPSLWLSRRAKLGLSLATG